MQSYLFKWTLQGTLSKYWQLFLVSLNQSWYDQPLLSLFFYMDSYRDLISLARLSTLQDENSKEQVPQENVEKKGKMMWMEEVMNKDGDLVSYLVLCFLCISKLFVYFNNLLNSAPESCQQELFYFYENFGIYVVIVPFLTLRHKNIFFLCLACHNPPFYI